MTGRHPAPRGKTPARRRSDLTQVKAWWRSLGGDGFVALPAPTRNRYTQTDGHGDAAELFAAQGLGADTSFAYWHWQAHSAFDGSGALTRELMLHWGGDHATVAAGLGCGPEGYQVVDGGPQGAFRLDRITHRDDTGLPGPEDPAGVRQFLRQLDTPIDRSRQPHRYRALTDIEADWLHDRLREPLTMSAVAGFATSLEHRDALTHDEVARLLPRWREEYAGRLAEWAGWQPLLHAMLRQDHALVGDVAAALGPRAARVLGQVPSERGLTAVRPLALTGDGAAISAWLTVHASTREPDRVRAANTLAAELTEQRAPQRSMRALFAALTTAATNEWREDSGADRSARQSFAALTTVRFTTDERLSHPLRVAAADAARDLVAHVREEAVRLGPAYSDLTGTTATDALAAADRYESVRDGLLTGTGPDLTVREGALCEVWSRYRALTDADIGWLRSQVTDAETGVQGVAFCLELLYAHGAATEAEVEALLPRWKKDLTKQYRTTYTEWRHPLVTLTCLALDLGHPVATDLVAWWAKPRPVWKNKLRLLTHLGAPDEAKAGELWEFIASGAHDEGHLMTWVLMRAKLDKTPPLLVADRLLSESAVRGYVLNRVLIGVADPAQPLWHYAVNQYDWGWWQRAQVVADHPELSPRARAVGLQAAREHCLIRYPDQLRPAPTPSAIAAARDWIDQRADARDLPGEAG